LVVTFGEGVNVDGGVLLPLAVVPVGTEAVAVAGFGGYPLDRAYRTTHAPAVPLVVTVTEDSPDPASFQKTVSSIGFP